MWEIATMEDAHAKSVDETLNFFGVDGERGLSTDQVKRNQEKYGLNGKWWQIIFQQFNIFELYQIDNSLMKYILTLNILRLWVIIYQQLPLQQVNIYIYIFPIIYVHSYQ